MTTDFWDLLTPEEQTDFNRRSVRRKWRRGEVLCREGDATEWVAVIEAGRLKASSHTANGDEVVLAIRGPRALLGELAAVDAQPRSATLVALEPVTARVMAPAEFQSYLAAHGRVALHLMRLLAERLRDADRKRIEFGTQDTTGRVAARLVELAERFGVPTAGGTEIALPLSQDELAGWVGSSREAVSKSLRALRAAGWIRTGRLAVTVLDLESLRRRSY